MERESIIEDMKRCLQTKDFNVLEHGHMVNRYYKELVTHLINGTELKLVWKLPQWIYDYKSIIITNLFDDTIMENYQIYHDCGKPYCQTIDDKGKQHFHNHAKISSEISKVLFPHQEIIHRLIFMDMDIHILKAKDITEFMGRPEAISLLITGLCEIHANASMFGGLEDKCFKIKWKQLNMRGKRILSSLSI